jgi:transcription initiation factor TFIIIB Brf1 subunit/transcription initiation factor TFIIB
MPKPGRIPPNPFEDLPVMNETAQAAWECADCGWGVEESQLLPGWTLEDARDKHTDRYCARPPIWSPE